MRLALLNAPSLNSATPSLMATTTQTRNTLSFTSHHHCYGNRRNGDVALVRRCRLDALFAVDPITSTSNVDDLFQLSSTLSSSLQVAASTSPVESSTTDTDIDIIGGTLTGLALAFLASFLQGRTPSSSNIILWSNPNNQRVVQSTEPNAEYITNNNITLTNSTLLDDEKMVFDEGSWKEISRPENYILYSTKVKKRLRITNEKEEPWAAVQRIVKDPEIKNTKDKSNTSTSSTTSSSTTNTSTINGARKEKKWVLLALLILFVPIFSIEFFFALSRQLICGDTISFADKFDIDAANSLSSTATSQPSSQWAQILCSPHIDD